MKCLHGRARRIINTQDNLQKEVDHLVNNPMWYIVFPAAGARSTSEIPKGDWRRD